MQLKRKGYHLQKRRSISNLHVMQIFHGFSMTLKLLLFSCLNPQKLMEKLMELS